MYTLRLYKIKQSICQLLRSKTTEVIPSDFIFIEDQQLPQILARLLKFKMIVPLRQESILNVHCHNILGYVMQELKMTVKVPPSLFKFNRCNFCKDILMTW
jgi:hypothetical protein